MIMNATAPQPENQPGDVNGRSPCTDLHYRLIRPARQEEALDEGLTDRQFWAETPDETAAARWFIDAFWPDGPGVRCPRCAWNERARPSLATDEERQYWCPRCRRSFSIKVETVMFRSHLTLQQWKQALFIWTGGPLPVSSKELGRRLGVSSGIDHDVTLRILASAREEFPPLREPAELVWFQLGGKPKNRHSEKRTAEAEANRKPRIHVIAMVGRHSGRTVIGKIDRPNKTSIHGFVRKHLAPGMDLYLSKHRLNQGIPQVEPHYLTGNDSSYLLLYLRGRIINVFDRVHNGFTAKYAEEYLKGIQWRENHRHLSHREKMIHLARGMRWKTPTPSDPESANGNGEGPRQQPGPPRGTRDRHHSPARANRAPAQVSSIHPAGPSTKPLPLHQH